VDFQQIECAKYGEKFQGDDKFLMGQFTHSLTNL
jgi:hypothetical protein